MTPDHPNLRSYFAEPTIDRSTHPIDPWRWIETAPPTSDLGVAESVFTVGNGYLGVRGNPEEGHSQWTVQRAPDHRRPPRAEYSMFRGGHSRMCH